MEEVHLLISKRPEDEELVRRLAERLGWEFNQFFLNRAVDKSVDQASQEHLDFGRWMICPRIPHRQALSSR